MTRVDLADLVVGAITVIRDQRETMNIRMIETVVRGTTDHAEAGGHEGVGTETLGNQEKEDGSLERREEVVEEDPVGTGVGEDLVGTGVEVIPVEAGVEMNPVEAAVEMNPVEAEVEDTNVMRMLRERSRVKVTTQPLIISRHLEGIPIKLLRTFPIWELEIRGPSQLLENLGRRWVGVEVEGIPLGAEVEVAIVTEMPRK